MSNNYDKNEIQALLTKYKYSFDLEFSKDNEFKNVLTSIFKFENSERPDAYYTVDNYCYAIEHFQVSQYKKIKGNQDISKKANGSQNHREKIKDDKKYDLAPSVENLISAIDMSLKSHSKSFDIYYENIAKKYSGSKYRLIIFIEDSTESAYIVKKHSNDYKSINPLFIKEIAELLMQYETSIYGVIYSYGNEMSKLITGCTLAELKEKLECNIFQSADICKPFEEKRKVTVSKDKQNDSNNITIKLFDRL